ncbi:hypothetical protein CU097_007922 [Rhizopus azygosporus]|uniref:Uncharacterized protein n=1 Tax=Rhizopus azygosporus TaxID=86630 RepID=A0A367J141_RHIAZ|nr:hypothetical protein CU097_007922 [Rhizopus azygosporus]
MDMEITHFIPIQLPQIDLLLLPFVLFLSITTIVELWKIAVVDRILDELKRKCALCERRSFFHPHSSLPIRHFYSQFIQVYPEQVDLWEEVFNIIENHRDAVTIRRVEDGEEVDVWNYGPYVLNFM